MLGGGDGNDTLSGGLGNDSLLGGPGNDSISGGDGDDVFGAEAGQDTLDGDAGNDRFQVSVADGTPGPGKLVTGGLGQDTYLILPSGGANYVVTDFTPGVGGDQLDLSVLLANSIGYVAGANPFNVAAGFIRLTQSGADTLLQWDRDGTAGSAYGLQTVLTLQNVVALNVTLDNVAGSAPPDWSTTSGLLLVGGSGNDNLTGGLYDDSISGLSGDDTLYGGLGGNDTLDGGDGNDNLSGGVGNDSLMGGSGNDTLDGGEGDDYVDAGDGNDYIRVDNPGNDTLLGGVGDDRFSMIGWFSGNRQLTGGSGQDTYQIWNPANTSITDFAAGAGGDILEVSSLLSKSPGYTSGNPFSATNGILRLTQSGSNTLLEWDRDGPSAGSTWQTVLTLQNVAASNLTLDNFTNGINPEGSSASGLNLSSSNADDTLTGGVGNDTILGLGGNDVLDGGPGGNDIVDGGDGNDTITGGTGADTLTGGNGADVFILSTPGHSGLTLTTADRITDFTSGSDVLRLGLAGTATNYSEAGAAVADFTAALAAANTALAVLNSGAGGGDAQLYNFQFDATNGYLFIDRNSDGLADEVIVLVGVNSGQIAPGDIGGP